MSEAFAISAAGLEAQQRALEVTANNIANVNTPAFKRAEVQFSEMVTQASDPDNPATIASTPALAGVSATTALTLTSQGEITQTGNAMDVAIDGAGFIPLLGAHGQMLLWRGGALHLDHGVLTAANGAPLAAAINVPDNAVAIDIGEDGQVRAHTAVGDAGNIIGRVSLVRIDDDKAVEALDGGVYRVNDESGVSDLDANAPDAPRLIQGAVERSNVDLSEEMVRLLMVQRAFAANAQILSAADQMVGIANNLRK
ncbi:MAG: flagellar hook basal-body protein [Terricaulis sp.]